jgi:hypothetical protein
MGPDSEYDGGYTPDLAAGRTAGAPPFLQRHNGMLGATNKTVTRQSHAVELLRLDL